MKNQIQQSSEVSKHVTVKAKYSHKKYQMDIFCGVKKSKKIYSECMWNV